MATTHHIKSSSEGVEACLDDQTNDATKARVALITGITGQVGQYRLPLVLTIAMIHHNRTSFDNSSNNLLSHFVRVWFCLIL
jgi:hypothetical protein